MKSQSKCDGEERGLQEVKRFVLIKSVTTSAAKAYQRLMLAALMSRGVLQAPAVNQAFILEQESIEDVTAPTKS